jgi:hypothetical protein
MHVIVIKVNGQRERDNDDEYPKKTTDLLQVTDKLILSHNAASPEWDSNSQRW